MYGRDMFKVIYLNLADVVYIARRKLVYRDDFVYISELPPTDVPQVGRN